jgi:hypothetical protein
MNKIFIVVFLSCFLPVTASAIEHRLDPSEPPHAHEQAEAPLMLAATVYYVWCIDEQKRIGGYTGDNTVANNRAKHHSWNTGHNTKVEIK